MVYLDDILHILILFTRWHAKRLRGFAEQQPSRLWPVSENEDNSWTTCILIKFYLLVHVNNVWPLVCKSATRLRWASVRPAWSLSEKAHNSWTILFDGRGFAEHPVIRPWPVMKNVHNSLTTWYCTIKLFLVLLSIFLIAHPECFPFAKFEWCI